MSHPTGHCPRERTKPPVEHVRGGPRSRPAALIPSSEDGWDLLPRPPNLIEASYGSGILSGPLERDVINNRFMEVLADLDPD